MKGHMEFNMNKIKEAVLGIHPADEGRPLGEVHGKGQVTEMVDRSEQNTLKTLDANEEMTEFPGSYDDKSDQKKEKDSTKTSSVTFPEDQRLQEGDQDISNDVPVVSAEKNLQDAGVSTVDNTDKTPISDLEDIRSEHIRIRKMHESAAAFLLHGKDSIVKSYPVAAKRAGACAIASMCAAAEQNASVIKSNTIGGGVEADNQLNA